MSVWVDDRLSSMLRAVYTGEGTSPTAEALMRSRYSAFVTGAVAYLVDTRHPDFRRVDEAVGISAWMMEVTSWDRLEVLVSQEGEPSDTVGWVAFNVTFTRGNHTEMLHECSRFRKVNGRWYYECAES